MDDQVRQVDQLKFSICYWMNNSSFEIKLISETRIKPYRKRLACGNEFPVRIQAKPFNIVFEHKERYQYYCSKSKKYEVTRYKDREEYCHVDSSNCISKRFPNFDNNLIDIKEHTYKDLTVGHKELLLREFNYEV